MKDTYYIYENWTASNVARIHIGSCTFCNNGQGIGRNILGNRNGVWHGPFSTYNQAFRYNGLHRLTQKINCSRCIQ